MRRSRSVVSLFVPLLWGCATNKVYHLGLEVEWHDATGPLDAVRTADQVVLSYGTLSEESKPLESQQITLAYPLSDAQFCAEHDGRKDFCSFDEPFFERGELPLGVPVPILEGNSDAPPAEHECILVPRATASEHDTTLRCRIGSAVCQRFLPARTTVSRVERALWSYPVRLVLYPLAFAADVLMAPISIGSRALRITSGDYWQVVASNFGVGPHRYAQGFFWDCNDVGALVAQTQQRDSTDLIVRQE